MGGSGPTDRRVADGRRSGVVAAWPRTIEPRYWPVFDLASERIVGADLVLAAAGSTGSKRRDSASVRERQLRAAARELSEGPAVAGRWWLGLPVTPAELAAGPHRGLLDTLVASGNGIAGRTVLHTTAEALAVAATSGAPACLGSLGVHAALVDPQPSEVAAAASHGLPIACVRVSLNCLTSIDPARVERLRSVVAVAEAAGIEVIGHDVETDDQLVLADRAGIALLQGYRWGSAGSFRKLVSMWTRIS